MISESGRGFTSRRFHRSDSQRSRYDDVRPLPIDESESGSLPLHAPPLARRPVDEDCDTVTDRLRVDEPHGLLVTRVAEEALAGAEENGIDH
jgi:hypothetical protein